MDLESFFDRVVVVSLKRRPDRLAAFQVQMLRCRWPFRSPEVFPAVDGQAVPRPRYFRQTPDGAGAWGCLRSHSAILERVLSDGDGSVLILEDDAWFPEPSTFAADVERFLTAVPAGWEGIMLGGQHMSAPEQVSPGVMRCTNTQRTHAYALRGRWLRDLYLAWQTWHTHIDHRMAAIVSDYRVYAPGRWLIGQEAGTSDIVTTTEPRRLWAHMSSSGKVPIPRVAPLAITCTCTEVGWCPHYRMQLTTRRLEIIQGVGISPEKRRGYLEHWSRQAMEPVKEPGLLQKAVNLAETVVQHVRHGLKTLPESHTRARLAVCQGCELFNAEKGSCLKCGCNMAVKASWAEQHCPHPGGDRWAEVDRQQEHS